MNRIAVCTCVAGNYVSYARVLAQSLRRHHPETKLHVLVVDKQPPRFERESLSASVVTLKDLRISKLWRMLLAYDRKQMVVAMKPALLRYVLDAGFESALFLDPDMLVMADLDPVFEAVASHSLTLTPHVGPALAAADKADLERSLLMAGMYNGGFVGISNRPESRRFLAWWEMRLGRLCFDAMQHGLHYDQRWLDLAPAFVEDLHLLRDPGCNFAYWNFPFRALQPEGDGFSVNGSPLRLFHFSGFDPAGRKRSRAMSPACAWNRSARPLPCSGNMRSC
jgi:hypothetical protein